MTKAQGGVGIFLAEKWIDEFIGLNNISDRIIVKVLIQGVIVSVISPKNKEGERILEFFAAMKMIMGNKIFKKS